MDMAPILDPRSSHDCLQSTLLWPAATVVSGSDTLHCAEPAMQILLPVKCSWASLGASWLWKTLGLLQTQHLSNARSLCQALEASNDCTSPPGPWSCCHNYSFIEIVIHSTNSSRINSICKRHFVCYFSSLWQAAGAQAWASLVSKDTVVPAACAGRACSPCHA